MQDSSNGYWSGLRSAGSSAALAATFHSSAPAQIASHVCTRGRGILPQTHQPVTSPTSPSFKYSTQHTSCTPFARGDPCTRTRCARHVRITRQGGSRRCCATMFHDTHGEKVQPPRCAGRAPRAPRAFCGLSAEVTAQRPHASGGAAQGTRAAGEMHGRCRGDASSVVASCGEVPALDDLPAVEVVEALELGVGEVVGRVQRGGGAAEDAPVHIVAIAPGRAPRPDSGAAHIAS